MVVINKDGKHTYEAEQRILNRIATSNVLNKLPFKIPGYTEMSIEPFCNVFMEEVRKTKYTKIIWTLMGSNTLTLKGYI